MSQRKLTTAAAAGLLTILCLVAFSARTASAQAAGAAQASRTGMESTSPRKMTDRMSAASLMGPVPVGGPWIEFAFMQTGSTATGCSPADPAGPGCGPSSAGNSVFGGAPPWTFNAPAGGAVITVTDAFLRGDQFDVFDGGTLIGTTSVPVTSGDCGSDPDVCVADAQVSHGAFNVGPGPHSIKIVAKASPFGAGAAYFRIDPAPPQMDHYLCYDVRPTQRFRQRRVTIRNQFEKQDYIVIGPRLLCVPSTKKLLQ